MKNGFIFSDGSTLDFIGAGQLSVGDGMQLDSKFSYDYSKKSQAITRRKKKTARTATCTLQIMRSVLNPEQNIFSVVSDFEAIVGQVGNLYWNGGNAGSFCVRGVSFSFAVDAIDIASGVQISLELTESYMHKDKNAQNSAPKVTIRHF